MDACFHMAAIAQCGESIWQLTRRELPFDSEGRPPKTVLLFPVPYYIRQQCTKTGFTCRCRIVQLIAPILKIGIPKRNRESEAHHLRQFLDNKNSPAATTTELSRLPDDVIHLQNHQYEPDDTANVTSDIKKIFRLTLHLSTSSPLETRE